MYPRPSRFARKKAKPETEAKAIIPEIHNKAAEPEAATEEVIVHLGGPWYSVGGEKVLGRANAEARAQELGLL
jgi:hypothetical protein